MTVTDAFRRALAQVRSNPAAVEAIDAAEAAKAAEIKAERDRRAKLEAKVEKGVAARTEILIQDYVELQQDALRAAAERLARAQLMVEAGLTPAATVAQDGYPVRIKPERVAAHHSRLAESSPVPWAGGQSGTALRSSTAKRAANERDAADAEQRAARLEAEGAAVDERVAQTGGTRSERQAARNAEAAAMVREIERRAKR